jgi:hypothetical protein
MCRPSDHRIRTKLATVLYQDRARFQRVAFADANVSRSRFSADLLSLMAWIGSAG